MSVIDLAEPDLMLDTCLRQAPEHSLWCGAPKAVAPRWSERGQNPLAGLACMSGRGDPKVARLTPRRKKRQQ
jgi:hypothetical protein